MKHFAPKITVVRGFFGSGKSILAKSLALDSSPASFDVHLTNDPDGDVIESGRAWSAQRKALRDTKVLIAERRKQIVVELLSPRLWHLQPFLALADNHGYSFDVVEPSTPWARDPNGCQERTRFPISEKSWRWLIAAWETNPSASRIRSSFSPEARQRIVSAILAGCSHYDGPAFLRLSAFLTRNFRVEYSGEAIRFLPRPLGYRQRAAVQASTGQESDFVSQVLQFYAP